MLAVLSNEVNLSSAIWAKSRSWRNKNDGKWEERANNQPITNKNWEHGESTPDMEAFGHCEQVFSNSNLALAVAIKIKVLSGLII